MFIAFTNCDKLLNGIQSDRDDELEENLYFQNLSKDYPFLILGKDNGWIKYKNLPKNFSSAAAIICFDFHDVEIEDESVSQNLNDLMTKKYNPYVVVLHHMNQHHAINQLITKIRGENSDYYYFYPDTHIPGSKYEIVIDLLLDAQQISCSNHKFVHDKTKPLRSKRIKPEISLLATKMEFGDIPTKLNPIFSMHETEYKNFLNEIEGNYDLNNESHVKKLEEFVLLLEEDEYQLTNPEDY